MLILLDPKLWLTTQVNKSHSQNFTPLISISIIHHQWKYKYLKLVATIQAIRMFWNLQHGYKNEQNLQHSNYRGVL